jgi:hypothetical protein
MKYTRKVQHLTEITYDDDIPIEKCANIDNLELILWQENLRKRIF